MFGESAADKCITDLKLKLLAAGFQQLTAGATVDGPTWTAIKVVAGSDIANKIAGRDVTPAVQAAACTAFQQVLSTQTPEQRQQFVAAQVAQLAAGTAALPAHLQPPKPLPKHLLVGLGLGVALVATGFWLSRA